MRALVIAPQPFFTPRGTPLSVYYRTMVMAELGVEVDLLTFGQGQDVDLPGVRVHRIPRLGGNHVKVGPSFHKLFLDFFILISMVRLLLTNRYDFVHAHEEAAFLCLFLKPLFRFRLVYDMHSSLPQQLTNFAFTKSKVAIGLFQKLEDAVLRSADFVITICEDLRQYVDQRIPDRSRHILIENSIFEPVRLKSKPGAQSSAVPIPDGLPAPAEWTVPVGKKLVVYAGTLEPYQGIEVLLRAFAIVVAQDSEAFLLIAGGQPDQVSEYRRMADELGLSSDVMLTGTVSKAQAGAFNRSAQALVSTRLIGGNTPLKIYEQLASGVPLVATDIHSHTQVLTEDVAFLVAPEPHALAEGILGALNDAPLRESKARNAQALYRRAYSRERYVEKVQQLLGALGECAASRG